MCFFLLPLGESLFRSLAHFLLDCKGSFYIPDISPLLYMWFHFLFWLCLFLSFAFLVTLRFGLYFMCFLLQRSGEGLLSLCCFCFFPLLLKVRHFSIAHVFISAIYVFVQFLMFHQNLRQLLRTHIIKWKNKYQNHRKQLLRVIGDGLRKVRMHICAHVVVLHEAATMQKIF